jgi:5-methylcytosine-specific restriction endonuclease McrA
MKRDLINLYDTKTTYPDRDAQYFLRRHLRRRGLLHEVGAGRLARFREIARYKPVTTFDVVAGRLDDVYVAEFRHYVWRVTPHCAYCNVRLTRETLTRDHVVPRARGGGGGDNLVPACVPCNRAKADHGLLHFLARRKERKTTRPGCPQMS